MVMAFVHFFFASAPSVAFDRARRIVNSICKIRANLPKYLISSDFGVGDRVAPASTVKMTDTPAWRTQPAVTRGWTPNYDEFPGPEARCIAPTGHPERQASRNPEISGARALRDVVSGPEFG